MKAYLRVTRWVIAMNCVLMIAQVPFEWSSQALVGLAAGSCALIEDWL